MMTNTPTTKMSGLAIDVMNFLEKGGRPFEDNEDELGQELGDVLQDLTAADDVGGSERVDKYHTHAKTTTSGGPREAQMAKISPFLAT